MSGTTHNTLEHRNRTVLQSSTHNQEEETLLKLFGMGALASIAALVLGFGLVGNAPTAQADTTDVVAVRCLAIAALVDGDADDTTTLADYGQACALNGLDGLAAGNPASAATQPGTVLELARTVGDEDNDLEASDLTIVAGYDDDQLSEACTAATAPTTVCAMLIFVFVDDERPVTLDNPGGLTSLQSPATTDYICNLDAASLIDTSILVDNDCNDAPASVGDGVVIFHVINSALASASDRGDTETVRVRQEDVEQQVDLNIVGTPNDVKLTVLEDLIETNRSAAQTNDCTQDTDVRNAIAPPNATLAFAEVFDEDDRRLSMVPVVIKVDPPADNGTIAALGIGNNFEDITGNSTVTVKPTDAALDDATDRIFVPPIAHYIVVCGGRSTGVTTIHAQIDDGDADLTVDDDTSEQEITVGGAPKNVGLTATASSIKCDGSEKSTVTAKVTDSAGNNVANGVPVRFTVVALGTANPINTVTEDGKATSVITPLSNSSAGVTVLVQAYPSGFEVNGVGTTDDVIETSIRVDCALPLVTQPTLSPPVPTGPIRPPDTGTGGYLAQDNGMSPWTLIALAFGAVALVGGSVVARNAK